jgi:hypothetical protein
MAWLGSRRTPCFEGCEDDEDPGTALDSSENVPMSKASVTLGKLFFRGYVLHRAQHQ